MKVVFRLQRYWKVGEKTVDLYGLIKSRKKTSEWRRATKYWIDRLCTSGAEYEIGLCMLSTQSPVDFTDYLKVKKAWFTVGFPKNNLPRLEADVTGLFYHPFSDQLEIQIKNVEEVT